MSLAIFTLKAVSTIRIYMEQLEVEGMQHNDNAVAEINNILLALEYAAQSNDESVISTIAQQLGL